MEGAPNFRSSDMNVYGVSQPTLTGLCTVLAYLQCHPQSRSSVKTLWFSTREEPIIYIHGTPFVLRDECTPKQNLRTFSGISSQRLEEMEARLKSDVIKESQRCKGLILVHDELGMLSLLIVDDCR